MTEKMTAERASAISAEHFRKATAHLKSSELALEGQRRSQQEALRHQRDAKDASAFMDSEYDLDRNKVARESLRNSEAAQDLALGRVGRYAVAAAHNENVAELTARGEAWKHYKEYGEALHDAAIADAARDGVHIEVQQPDAMGQEVPVNVHDNKS